MEFNLDQWCEDNKLTQETCGLLKDKGLESSEALRELNDEIIDKHFKKLQLGQVLLLCRAVKELKTPAEVSDETQESGEEEEVTVQNTGLNLEYEDVLKLIGSNHQGSTSKSAKFRDVRDYIMYHTIDNDKHSGDVEFGDFQLKIKDRKPPLQNISCAQYYEGAIRILLEMIKKDKAPQATIEHYLDYLIKISCFGQAFQWETVTKFDYEFRKKQASMGREWNADDAFLSALHLKAKSTSSESAPKPTSRKQRYNPNSGTTICEKFNGKKGCNFQNCKYSHVCNICFSASHAGVNHRDTKSKSAEPKNE